MNWLIIIKNEDCPFLGTEKDFGDGDNKCHYSESVGKGILKNCEKKICPIVNKIRRINNDKPEH